MLADFASVNFSEAGALELCRLLLDRGIGVEAGLWTVADADAFVTAGIADQCLRALVEPQEAEGGAAVATAEAVEAALTQADIGLPQLHHGYGIATWAVIERALERGHDIRAGLEDTTQLPDGTTAPDNAALITEAVRRAKAAGRIPTA